MDLLLTLAFLLFACFTVAHADESAGPSYLLNLAPLAFRPVNSGVHFSVDEGGLGRLCSLQGSGYFVAPLQLDDGVTVERITAFVQDDNKEAFGFVSLVRRTPDKAEVLAITPMSAGGRDLETLSADVITTPVIDNHRYSYLLQAALTGPNVCLCGVQVQYRVRAVLQKP